MLLANGQLGVSAQTNVDYGTIFLVQINVEEVVQGT